LGGRVPIGGPCLHGLANGQEYILVYGVGNGLRARAVHPHLPLYAMGKILKLDESQHGEHNLVAQRFHLVYMEPLRLADSLQLLAEL
jgi:hypothetical protein